MNRKYDALVTQLREWPRLDTALDGLLSEAAAAIENAMRLAEAVQPLLDFKGTFNEFHSCDVVDGVVEKLRQSANAEAKTYEAKHVRCGPDEAAICLYCSADAREAKRAAIEADMVDRELMGE